jgi:hypothetical protein
MSFHLGRGIYRWMENEIWIFRNFLKKLEFKWSKMTIFEFQHEGSEKATRGGRG